MSGDATARLAGSVALVTGAGAEHGIGRSTAVTLARRGARVVVSGRPRADVPAAGWKGLESLVEEIASFGGEAVAVTADVADPASVERLVDRAIEQWGRLDVVVNNAAARQEPRVAQGSWELALEDWQTQLDVNLTGPFLVSRRAIPHMLSQGRGRIVNVSSLAARLPMHGRAGYCSSKHGLTGLTRVLAAELGAKGITVNAVCPGVIATDRLPRPEGGGASPWDATVQTVVPARRAGDPAEVADLIAFLASDEAAYITGQSINVDGGWVMS